MTSAHGLVREYAEKHSLRQFNGWGDKYPTLLFFTGRTRAKLGNVRACSAAAHVQRLKKANPECRQRVICSARLDDFEGGLPVVWSETTPWDDPVIEVALPGQAGLQDILDHVTLHARVTPPSADPAASAAWRARMEIELQLDLDGDSLESANFRAGVSFTQEWEGNEHWIDPFGSEANYTAYLTNLTKDLGDTFPAYAFDWGVDDSDFGYQKDLISIRPARENRHGPATETQPTHYTDPKMDNG